MAIRKYILREIAKMEGVTVRAVQGWDESELSSKGWKKVGHGRGSYFLRTLDLKEGADDFEEDLTDLKIRRLKADIQLKEEKSIEMKKLQYYEWCDLYTEAFALSFAPFKQKVYELKLDNDKTTQLMEIFQECLKTLQKESENIFNSALTQNPSNGQ
jgi:hypothetical protein